MVSGTISSGSRPTTPTAGRPSNFSAAGFRSTNRWSAPSETATASGVCSSTSRMNSLPSSSRNCWAWCGSTSSSWADGLFNGPCTGAFPPLSGGEHGQHPTGPASLAAAASNGECPDCNVSGGSGPENDFGGGWRVEGGGWRVEGGGWREKRELLLPPPSTPHPPPLPTHLATLFVAWCTGCMNDTTRL